MSSITPNNPAFIASDQTYLEGKGVSIEVKDKSGYIVFNDRRFKVSVLTASEEPKTLTEAQMRATASKVAVMLLKQGLLKKESQAEPLNVNIDQYGFKDLTNEEGEESEYLARHQATGEKNTEKDYKDLMLYLTSSGTRKNKVIEEDEEEVSAVVQKVQQPEGKGNFAGLENVEREDILANREGIEREDIVANLGSKDNLEQRQVEKQEVVKEQPEVVNKDKITKPTETKKKQKVKAKEEDEAILAHNIKSDKKTKNKEIKNAKRLTNEPPKPAPSISRPKSANKPSNDASTFLAKVPNNVTQELLSLPGLSEAEKQELSKAAKRVYTNNGLLQANKNIETAEIEMALTMDYLSDLAIENSNFSVIPLAGERVQFSISPHGQGLKMDNVDAVAASLPKTLDGEPSIFGHAVRIGGNHRTGMVIDLKNRTVEYYNSLGDDAIAAPDLTKFTAALKRKYGVDFSYIHKTQGMKIQNDTYQCGIWTCKMIEERIKQGQNFNPATCKGFNIGAYRKEVLVRATKVEFYREIGRKRLDAAFREAIAKGYDPIRYGKAIALEERNFYRYYREWCRTGKMPRRFRALLNQAI